MSIKVLVPLAPGFEELEAVTITDLCQRAGFAVSTAGLVKRNVQAARGLNVVADTVLAEVVDQSFDAVILPGGLPGADYLCQSDELKQILINQHQQQKCIAAICAAPKVLVECGIIIGNSFAAYPGSQQQYLDNDRIDMSQLSDQAVCVQEHVITSRGPGTALDFSLQIIEQLTTQSHRQQVESALAR